MDEPLNLHNEGEFYVFLECLEESGQYFDLLIASIPAACVACTRVWLPPILYRLQADKANGDLIDAWECVPSEKKVRQVDAGAAIYRMGYLRLFHKVCGCHAHTVAFYLLANKLIALASMPNHRIPWATSVAIRKGSQPGVH